MASPRKRTVLVVDDDEINLMILQKGVEEAGYEPVAFPGAEEAWQYLLANDEKIDIALLDKMMPGTNGIELLKRIKGSAKLRHIPAIIQTGDVGLAQMREGLEAGAYYYLTKPFHPEILVALLRSAARECELYDALRRQSTEDPGIFLLLKEGDFTLKTHDEARRLAVAVSQAAFYPEFALVGLSELLSNSIEHGNLAIGYNLKREWLLAGNWDAMLAERAADPLYQHRAVRILCKRLGASLQVAIKDEGEGFDWRYQSFDDRRHLKLNEPNGRGIAKAKVMLDSVDYAGSGNEVQCRIQLKAEPEGDSRLKPVHQMPELRPSVRGGLN